MEPQTHIRQVTVYEVVVPARPGAINSPEYGSFIGHDWDRMPLCLIEVQMDDGLTGLGEIGRGVTLQQLDSWLAELPGVGVRGLVPVGLPERWQPLSLYGGVLEERHPPGAWASPSPLADALEMALLDWAGKRLGCRVVDLLGGAYREEVPVDYWCGRKTPQDLARTVAQARERGFKGLKMKSRMGDPVAVQVQVVRDAGGEDFSITIDPMYQWFGPEEGLAMLRGLERFGSGIRVEDPFPADMPEFWRRARTVCSIPLIWHVRSIASLRRALQEQCADGFNCSGGAHEFLTATHAAEVAGYSCWRGSSLEMGVGQVAALHAAAAARCCVMASDFQSGVIREHTLIAWDWPYHDGLLPLPTGPGLGIELDRAAITHYQQAKQEYRK